MRISVPSFRTQIVLLVLFLVIVSALFFRYFFLESFREYTIKVEKLDVSGKINRLYQDYSSSVPPASRDRFKEEVESVLSTEWQRNMQADLFRKEINLYSKFIFVFLVVVVLVLFFLMFNLVSRPLQRLQAATEELSKGNWGIRVQESRFSPLNNLIASFNKMADELESSREKLIQAEKEVIWREMARVMAHEITNPLTPIRLALERLESKYLSGPEGFRKAFQSARTVIHEEIDNLRSLATAFSEFARLPESSIAPYDLNEQLRELIIPYEDQALFRMQLSGDLPPLHADRRQVKQVLTNIIQNAIQSSGDDCTIRISTSSGEGHIGITIADHGSGISRGDLPKIFEPYFSRREKGTGLGLAIVKRIVEQHKGFIEVESELGEGTTFVLTFPSEGPEEEAAT